MQTPDRRRLERLTRRVEELRLWRNARERPVEGWRFSTAEKEYGISIGDRWPEVGVPVWFSGSATIPEEWAGEAVELELWLGGEGFVTLSNGVSGGLNVFHRSFPVAEKALGGEEVRVEAEVVPKGMFGTGVAEPRLVRSVLTVPDREVRGLERDLAMISEACECLDGHEAVPWLLDALEAAFGVLFPCWPTDTDTSLTRYLEGFTDRLGDLAGLPPPYARKVLEDNRAGFETWTMPSAPDGLRPLPEEASRAVREARQEVARRIEEIKKDYPPAGRLALTGHAHLDLAWLWPVAESRRKARRTFASVLGLIKRHEDFVFNQSSAQLYAWIEEQDPEMFQELRRHVLDGRWEPVGGSWVEPDCQMPGGESFVRQLLYGQRYFESRFGRRSTVAWLPDTFGFSPAIPQLLRGAGMTGFFTYKLNWSEANKFPHDLFLWEGLDGSRVVAHAFENPGTDYNGDVAPRDLLGTWRNFRGKRRHPESLFSFGWGDGGGGPTEQMLENYERLKEFPALPRLRMTRVDDFFRSLPVEDLPRWVGELYLELHRGTLTSQGRIKKLNRDAEHRLLEAEAFAAIAALRGLSYPAEEIEHLWKTVLLNQFHDILPGSSIAEVFEESQAQLEEAVYGAEKVRYAALCSLGEGEIVVANAALYPRPLSAVLPEGFEGVVSAEGEPLPVQLTEEGLLVHDPERRVPGLGWISLGESREPSPETSGGLRISEAKGSMLLENELLRVEVGSDGTLHRVHDKVADREVLAERGNQLWAYADKPREWDAWDIDEDYEREGEELLAQEVRVVEEGPLRVALRVARRWRGSEVTQTYRLLSGSRRLDVVTEIEWRERQVLLRALVPLDVRAHEATFETMCGVVRRPVHRNTSWDIARFEVAAHRFADLSETGYGVALLNDGRYGHSARDNVLGISLLRSPVYPDPLADEGHHRFTYSLFPHPGDWTEAGVAEEAFALNSPLRPLRPGRTEEGPASETGFVTVEGTKLALSSLKRSGDGRGFVLRLYEPHGARGACVLRFVGPVRGVTKANLLEEERERLEVLDNAVRLHVTPFEVLTLRVEPDA